MLPDANVEMRTYDATPPYISQTHGVPNEELALIDSLYSNAPHVAAASQGGVSLQMGSQGFSQGSSSYAWTAASQQVVGATQTAWQPILQAAQCDREILHRAKVQIIML